MIRFPFLEELGVRVALVTDRRDGDFSGVDGRAAQRLVDDLDQGCGPVVMLKQVHGTDVHTVDSIPANREGDGLITVDPGQPIAIRVADCVPVFLVDVRKPVCALLHAGWRGTLGGIAARGVEILCGTHGCHPEEIHAVIGPSAGPEKYEVSQELATRFSDAGFPVRGRLVDLWESNVLQLRKSRIPRKNIYVSKLCTIADKRFFSHRRDRETGRNLALLAL